jgi:hypothetical protein
VQSRSARIDGKQGSDDRLAAARLAWDFWSTVALERGRMRSLAGV